MARHGENIYKRKDGRWEGRYIKGYDAEGNVFTENMTNSDIDATLIICIYDTNNILKSISKENITIPANAEAFRTPLTLENFNNGMSIKVAVYKNDGTLKPISPFLHQ